MENPILNHLRELIAKVEGITVEEVIRREKENKPLNPPVQIEQRKSVQTGEYLVEEKIKLTKTNLNKIIPWTSSKFNLMKKKEVVDDIYKKAKAKQDCVATYNAGAYSWRNGVAEYEHRLIIQNGVVKLICGFGTKAQKVYQLID